MSLFYYILNRALIPSDMEYGKGKLLFVIIQFLWIVMIPFLIISKLIDNKILGIHLSKTENNFLFFFELIAILIFDYFYYFRKIKENEIIKKYTNKYNLIENKPILTYFISYFSLLLLWVIFTFFIIKF